jgi:hypothetical protein
MLTVVQRGLFDGVLVGDGGQKHDGFLCGELAARDIG